MMCKCNMGLKQLLKAFHVPEIHYVFKFVSDLLHYLIRIENCSLLIIKGIKEGCIKFLCFEKTANHFQEVGN